MAATTDAISDVATTQLSGWCDEDPPIRRQKYACVSIMTPSDIDERTRAYNEARAFALDCFGDTFKSAGDYDAALTDWLATRQADLDDDIRTQCVGMPHIPIMKVRGVFRSEADARAHCRNLARIDRVCDIYVAPVGRWVPADGRRRETETEMEYAEQQMQSLMKQRKASQELARQEFERRRREAVTAVGDVAAETSTPATTDDDAPGMTGVTGVTRTNNTTATATATEEDGVTDNITTTVTH